MKLSYRGHSYESHHEPVETVEGGVGGHYRGLPWRMHCHKQQARQHNRHELTYRGIHYKH